jgi:hypothetical protein
MDDTFVSESDSTSGVGDFFSVAITIPFVAVLDNGTLDADGSDPLGNCSQGMFDLAELPGRRESGQ